MVDPGFRRHVQAQEAIESGELSRAADPRALARVVQALLGGSLISWGFLREGSAQTWVRRDLDVLLSPWLTRRPARRRRP